MGQTGITGRCAAAWRPIIEAPHDGVNFNHEKIQINDFK